ncbi:hypothetical protein ACFQZ2_10180 [Streptomonospora algeriensis]|uniref:Uncharacterized protein n=1 Tax=Streptomonospora algeriensis TaxID=995084 RepID=A0ABW3BFE3_9ACTN
MSEETHDYTIDSGQSPPSGPPPGPPSVPAPPSASEPPSPPGAEDVAAVAGPLHYDPTTRLRCAAWLEGAFRNRVLIERKEHSYRAWAREPGLDAEKVVTECERARRTMSIAGLLLTALVLLLAVFHLFVAVLAAVGCLWLALRTGWREFWRGQSSAAKPKGLRIMGGVLVFLVLLAAITASWNLYSALSEPAPQYDLGAQGAMEPGSDYDPPSEAGFGALVPWPVAVLLLLAGALAVGCWMRAQRNRALNAIVAAGRTSTRRIGESGVGTVPVGFYSDFSPFVGAGVRFGSWPLTLDLKPAAEPGASAAAKDAGGSAEADPGSAAAASKEDSGSSPKPAPRPGPELVEELYAGLRTDLEKLSEDGEALSTRRTVDVADCAFVSGVRTDRPADVRRRMLTGNGTGHLRPDWVRALIRTSHERARHFLEAGVSMWESQIVVTAFVRLSLHGGSLRVEGETFVMPPISARYSVPEEEQPTGEDAEGRIGVLGSAVANLFGDARTAVAEFEADLASQWRASGIEREQVEVAAKRRQGGASGIAGEEAALAQKIQGQNGASRPAVERTEQKYVALIDYAPRTSIRELAADPHYQQLFQRHDVQRVTGAVTKRCLTSLARVLKDKGYDTSDLEGLVQNINVGLQNFGTANVNGIVSAGSDNTISQQPQAGRSGGAGSAPPQM